jgi:Ser/Thr protein kinase RdoA (MazF antagonist)
MYTVCSKRGKPLAVLRVLIQSSHEQAQHELNALSTVSAHSLAPRPLSNVTSLSLDDGFAQPVPLIVLDYVKSCVPCEEALSRAREPADAVDLLESAGSLLGMLHSRCAAGDSMRFVYEGGGCCDLWKHVNGEGLNELPCDSFYSSRVPELRRAIGPNAPLPRGFCHGDAFLDNILANTESNTAEKLVDWEDAARGTPLLFDVACISASAAFAPLSLSLTNEQTEQTEAVKRVEAVLRGYTKHRKLQGKEIHLMLPAMRAALLCNYHFRALCVSQESANELKDRIEMLERVSFCKAIERAVSAAASPGSAGRKQRASKRERKSQPESRFELSGKGRIGRTTSIFRKAARWLRRNVRAVAVQAAFVAAAVGIVWSSTSQQDQQQRNRSVHTSAQQSS